MLFIYSYAAKLCKELFIIAAIPSHSVLAYWKQNMPMLNPEQFCCDHVDLTFLDELIDSIKSRLSSLKSKRVVLFSKLPPEVIVHGNPFESSKHLSKQFAARLPSRLLTYQIRKMAKNVMI